MKMTVDLKEKRSNRKKKNSVPRQSMARRFVPTLLCLALFPASFALAEDVVEKDHIVVVNIDLKGNQYGTKAYATDADSASALNNQLTLASGSSSNIDNSPFIIGGYAPTTNGNATSEGNTVTVERDSSLNNFNIRDGYAESTTGTATSNGNTINVELTGESSSVSEIYGSSAYTGSYDDEKIKISASSNTVKVTGNGGTVHYVYGGYADAGSETFYSTEADNAKANNNYVELNNVKVAGVSIENEGYYEPAVVGGYSRSGNANGNTVIMNGSDIADGYIAGGETEYGTNASGNTVKVTGDSKINPDMVFGGKVSHNGNASDNYVELNNVDVGRNSAYKTDLVGYFHGAVYGGHIGYYSNNGSANNNTVKMTGGSAEQAYGGYVYVETGNASGNTVEIAGAKVTSEVVGGRSHSGNAINNTVTISGNADVSNAALYGGFANNTISNTDVLSGNTLNVNDTTGNGFTAKSIANFETVNVTFSKIPANGAVLELTDSTATDLSNTTSTEAAP